MAAAQQKEEAAKPVQDAALAPEEPTSETEAVISAPPEEADAEPEAAYEAARTEQVVEAAAGTAWL